MRSFLFIAILFSSMWASALDPSATYATTPADYGLNYEEVTFKTSDNLNLKDGCFILPKSPTK